MCIEGRTELDRTVKPIVSPDESVASLRAVVDRPSTTDFPALSVAAPRNRDGGDDSDSSYEPTPPPSPVPTRRTTRTKGRCGPRPKHPHLITQHNYHDHALDPVNNEHLEAHQDKNGHTHHHMMAFPLKLYDMLERVEAEGKQDIVSWQSHGRCFVVHDSAKFKQLLPNYFKLSKIASFQRQLNLYGFQRLTAGLDKGGYYNERFLRGRIDLVANIQRVKVKGTGVRAKANPEDEPNLYFYPAIDSAASQAGITTEAAAADVDMVSSSDDYQKVPAFETEDQQLPPTQMMPPPPRQVLPLPTSMMMVPRNYDKVQESLEQNAERLIQDQKQQLRNQRVGDLLNQAMVTTTTTTSSSLVPDETRDPTYVDVNFDKLIDEMFRHDQSLDFSDLLKLAAV